MQCLWSEQVKMIDLIQTLWSLFFSWDNYQTYKYIMKHSPATTFHPSKSKDQDPRNSASSQRQVTDRPRHVSDWKKEISFCGKMWLWAKSRLTGPMEQQNVHKYAPVSDQLCQGRLSLERSSSYVEKQTRTIRLFKNLQWPETYFENINIIFGD